MRKKKDGSQPSFAEKWKRGEPKARKWTDKNFLSVLRADFAQIQNEVLERNGFSIRVDHRTLKAQKEEAERNGDAFLARLFNRVPEKYVGIISCQEEDEPRLARLKEFRALRKQHFDLVMKLDALTKEADELEVKDAVQISSTAAKNLIGIGRSSFIQQQYYLTKQRALLEMEKTRLERLNISLKKRQSELETLCQEHDSVRKIELIAAGILRKNYNT